MRDAHTLKAAMAITAEYLPLETSERNPCDYVPELSRRGRAIPVWAVLRALGRTGRGLERLLGTADHTTALFRPTCCTTPVSELIMARLAGGDPASFFSSFDGSAANTVSEANVQAAVRRRCRKSRTGRVSRMATFSAVDAGASPGG